jgi:parallel beta-helix repeat protein
MKGVHWIHNYKKRKNLLPKSETSRSEPSIGKKPFKSLKTKQKAFVISVGIILSSLMGMIAIIPNNPENNPNSPIGSHHYLHFNSNSELDSYAASHGIPGTGGINDPYRFENQTYDSSSGQFQMQFCGISRYVIIQNNNFTVKKGISIINSDTITITHNKIINTTFGIEGYMSRHLNITYNQFLNPVKAIQLKYCRYNLIDHNSIHNASSYGIRLFFSKEINITNNAFLNNNKSISLKSSTYNYILSNVFLGNPIGIELLPHSTSNYIALNNFTQNTECVRDIVGNNQYHVPIGGQNYGNFYDNYLTLFPEVTILNGTLAPVNLFGMTNVFVGSIPYPLGLGVSDIYPILILDNPGIPTISISSPSQNSVHGSGPTIIFDTDLLLITSISVNVSDSISNIQWELSIGEILAKTFVIYSTLWNSLGEGTLTIILSAENYYGLTGIASVSIGKDSLNPIVSILSPTPASTFGAQAPGFQLSITEPNLESIIYSLDNFITNYSCSAIDNIDQTEWNKFANGSITIKWAVRDILGRQTICSVLVYKDLISPVISIIAPAALQLFGNNAPGYSIEITEINFDPSQVAYQINNGPMTYITSIYANKTFEGQIIQSQWSNAPEGIVEIKFSAWDLYNNLGTMTVQVEKDSKAPILACSLNNYTAFESNSPELVLSISDLHLDSLWYSMINQSLPFSLNKSEMTGPFLTVKIDETAWNSLDDGLIAITFFGNDTMGNIASVQLLVVLDRVAGQISIHSPINESSYGMLPPSYNITIIESNIASAVIELEDLFGIQSITLSNVGGNYLGTIPIAIWNNVANGSIIFRVKVVDAVGHVSTLEHQINHNLALPTIEIYTDSMGIYALTPMLNVSISGATNAYIIIADNTTELTLPLIQPLVQSPGDVWNLQADGLVNITIIAINSVGNLSQTITVQKDTIGPSISAQINSIYGAQAPVCAITITDLHFQSAWYTFDNGIRYPMAASFIGQLEGWDLLSNGSHVLTIYATDGINNKSNLYSIEKDNTAPIIEIYYPITLIAENKSLFYLFEISDAHLESIQIIINGGQYNFIINITPNSNSYKGSLDLSQLNLTNDTLFFSILANDSFGNQNNQSISITILRPTLIDTSINSETLGGIFKDFPWIFIIYFFVFSFLLLYRKTKNRNRKFLKDDKIRNPKMALRRAKKNRKTNRKIKKISNKQHNRKNRSKND